jgi:RHS repeat-associated protein
LGNGLVEARSYDTYRQQLTGVSLGPNGSILNLGFDYCTNTHPQTSCTNNNGNLQSQTIWPLGVAQTYTYDSYNRLYTSGEKANTTTTWSENFNYDGFGNRWVLPNSVGITLSPWTVTTNYYNSATNRLTFNNFGYDNGGNQTTISPYSVSYDVENRQSGFTSTSNGSATYTYDGDGRRVEKTAGGVTTTYVYDATGNLAAEYSSQPPSMPCQTCYLTTDHLGSTRVITSQTGGLVSRHDFLPFGEELATTNRTAAQGYGVADNVMQRYTGQQRDLEGPVLDFFGARYFQGAQGRFTGPDAKQMTRRHLIYPQKWNKYAYVRNNPMATIDPDGKDDFYVFRPMAGNTRWDAQENAKWTAVQTEAPAHGNNVVIFNGADANAVRYIAALHTEGANVVETGHTVDPASPPPNAGGVLLGDNFGVGDPSTVGSTLSFNGLPGYPLLSVPTVEADTVALFGCYTSDLAGQYSNATFTSVSPLVDMSAADVGALAYTATLVNGGTVDAAVAAAQAAMVLPTQQQNSRSDPNNQFVYPSVTVTPPKE